MGQLTSKQILVRRRRFPRICRIQVANLNEIRVVNADNHAGGVAISFVTPNSTTFLLTGAAAGVGTVARGFATMEFYLDPVFSLVRAWS
jgi:hypothetical protein